MVNTDPNHGRLVSVIRTRQEEGHQGLSTVEPTTHLKSCVSYKGRKENTTEGIPDK